MTHLARLEPVKTTRLWASGRTLTWEATVSYSAMKIRARGIFIYQRRSWRRAWKFQEPTQGTARGSYPDAAEGDSVGTDPGPSNTPTERAAGLEPCFQCNCRLEEYKSGSGAAHHRVGAALGTQLAHDGVDVELYRVLADAQPGGDHFVGESFRQELEHFTFPVS